MASFSEVDETLRTTDATFRVQVAQPDDLHSIVALLSEDFLGAGRESAEIEPYRRAFNAIVADPSHALVVVRTLTGEVVATMQMTLIPGLSRGGITRLQIEGVRVADTQRGTGLGSALFRWAHQHGRGHGAALAQLTTDQRRADAHRFYELLGYRASHTGMKLDLTDP